MKNIIEKKLFSLAKRIYPIHRSITGTGVEKTLEIIKNQINELKIKKTKTGTKVFDWKIPDEWNIKDAYIIDPKNKKICEFKKNNLHIVNYSVRVNKLVSLNNLKKNLFTLPNRPNSIPYVTSYYKKIWGFCIKYNDYKKLRKGNYRVFIKSNHKKGFLHYGEIFIKGKTKKEIFLSTYICHPSLANNETSGPVVTTFLVKWIKSLDNFYSYRIVFVPETIGSINYISKNINKLKKNVVAGINITCVGDNRNYSYLSSRAGNTKIDKIALNILKYKYKKFRKYNWLDRGSDERQYCSPGVNLPMISLMRTKYGQYPEYHNSDDKLGTVVTPKGLYGGYNLIKDVIYSFEKNCIPVARFKCEPFLSKRKLYPTTSFKRLNKEIKLLTNFLSYCDGENDLVNISDILNLSFLDLKKILDLAKKHKLIYIKKLK